MFQNCILKLRKIFSAWENTGFCIYKWKHSRNNGVCAFELRTVYIITSYSYFQDGICEVTDNKVMALTEYTLSLSFEAVKQERSWLAKRKSVSARSQSSAAVPFPAGFPEQPGLISQLVLCGPGGGSLTRDLLRVLPTQIMLDVIKTGILEKGCIYEILTFGK